MAEYDYDALGRRVRKIDYLPTSVTTLYYYNNNWQVLIETDGSGTYDQMFVYGNYIDEVLYRATSWGPSRKYYLHDHLYSTVALVQSASNVSERYEYNAYGEATVYTNMSDWDSATSTTANASNFSNPYTFTGRRLDVLDDGDLSIMYYRHRYYKPDTGRFFQQDPLGIDPVIPNANPLAQYSSGMSLYEYVKSNAPNLSDPTGQKPWYGNYCGPGNNGGKPKDDLDRACKKHDDCYTKCGKKGPWGVCGFSFCARNCDRLLCIRTFFAKCGFFDFKCKLARRLARKIFCANGLRPI